MVEYFAQTDLSELSVLLGAVFTAFGTLLFGFYKYAQAREEDFEKSRKNQVDAFDKTIKHLAKSINASTKAHKEVARETKVVAIETKKAAEQAEKRNGHLAELQIEARADIINAINQITTQKVKDQIVEHQHVNEKE